MELVTDNSDNRRTVYNLQNSTDDVSKNRINAYLIRAYRKSIFAVCENRGNQKITSSSRIKESLCKFALVNIKRTVNFIKN